MTLDRDSDRYGLVSEPVVPDRPAPYLIDQHLSIPAYEIGETQMAIHDVVWGDCEIGDQPHDELLIKLAKTPLFQRLQSIELLSRYRPT